MTHDIPFFLSLSLSFYRSLARSRPPGHTFLVRETTRGRDLKFSLARKTLSVRSIKDNGV